jgi:hypothetical protein
VDCSDQSKSDFHTNLIASFMRSNKLIGIMGTPGGDSGEFLLALAVYARNGGSVSDEDVLNLFKDFVVTLPTSRQFYMHTDKNTMMNLTVALKVRLERYVHVNIIGLGHSKHCKCT